MGEVKAPNSPIDTGNKFRYLDGAKLKETNMKMVDVVYKEKVQKSKKTCLKIHKILQSVDTETAFTSLVLTVADLLYRTAPKEAHEKLATIFSRMVKDVILDHETQKNTQK